MRQHKMCGKRRSSTLFSILMRKRRRKSLWLRRTTKHIANSTSSKKRHLPITTVVATLPSSSQPKDTTLITKALSYAKMKAFRKDSTLLPSTRIIRISLRQSRLPNQWLLNRILLSHLKNSNSKSNSRWNLEISSTSHKLPSLLAAHTPKTWRTMTSRLPSPKPNC